jgi:hypothetical protein
MLCPLGETFVPGELYQKSLRQSEPNAQKSGRATRKRSPADQYHFAQFGAWFAVPVYGCAPAPGDWQSTALGALFLFALILRRCGSRGAILLLAVFLHFAVAAAAATSVAAAAVTVVPTTAVVATAVAAIARLFAAALFLAAALFFTAALFFAARSLAAIGTMVPSAPATAAPMAAPTAVTAEASAAVAATASAAPGIGLRLHHDQDDGHGGHSQHHIENISLHQNYLRTHGQMKR